ncbi:uncharacterized protein Z519_01521 [Cladophialophora bantiana CBS 173.52]|uniref:Uncharacterized protein n=1 Tax=Cladophialophora bantiana (strain ATCC 10958 / CBS 173.52 / CDC B-1940 / NIH 8579) TaxID=1442370 RepID=A0A0D2GHW6_CLAB1|nr:uncharacterized protein Z519_01521 [Cladophialophora bantiana CBS 173.52]KIW97937.1 hypothetical protein Z519_01521 [Cladophialophora bantiana CBS 173.52]
MFSLWSLVLLPIALSSALNLDLNLDLSLGKKTPLRFMRRNIIYWNTTSPHPDLASEASTVTSSSATSTSVPSETTSSPVSTIASSSSTSTFTPVDTRSSLPPIAQFSPPSIPAPSDTSTTITVATIYPPPIPARSDTSTSSTTIASFAPPPIFAPVGSNPSTTTVTAPTNTSTSLSSESISSDIGTHINGSTPPALKTPPPLPSITRPFTNTTISLDLGMTTNSSTVSPTCTGSVTYFGTVPPTVYVTVTEGFDVTVTASNESMTEMPTLITPLPACEATIMPLAASYSYAPLSTESEAPSNVPQFATNNPLIAPAPESTRPVVPAGTPAIATPPTPLASSASAASTAVYSSVDYTSTVVVTKKTPVPVVIPPTTSVDINFNFPSQSSTPPPSGNSGNNGGGGGNTPAPGGSNNAPAPPATSNGGGSFPSISNQGPTGGSLIVEAPTTTKIGNIIASIINSPFATASPTGHASGAAPLTTTVDGVPIVVQPSSVVIGGQTVAIPNLVPTTVQASGAVFTVEPSKIIAPSATITIQLQRDQIVTPVPTATITTAVGDLTLTVGPTVAIISGTTYRIGEGAPATTIIVDGTRISIGSAGVGLPSTTVAPGGATNSPFVVYTVQGLTFSIDATEAIVGGTTYRIGSNAPQVTTTIGSGHVSVSFGPGGVGLESTTIVPATASSHISQTTKTGSKSTPATASPTQSANVANEASSQVCGPVVLRRCLFVLSLGWLVL